MLSSTLLLALLTAPSLLVTAGPNPATNDNTPTPPSSGGVAPQAAGPPAAAGTFVPITITSATIKQQGWSASIAGFPSRRRRRQDAAAANPAATITTGPPQPSPTDGSSLSSPPDSELPPVNGPALNQTISNTMMETFTLQLVEGTPSMANKPINCNLTWDAGEANGVPGVVSKFFTCSDAQTTVRMERRNVTPRYGFYIFVGIANAPQVAWMTRDLSHSQGWTCGGDLCSFSGQANLTSVPDRTLEDWLAGQ